MTTEDHTNENRNDYNHVTIAQIVELLWWFIFFVGGFITVIASIAAWIHLIITCY